ncbi:hypothetical protein ACS0TY_008215 [Phlomoides rotata]
MATTANAFVLAPFTGKGDFSIWKQKMKCILIHQRVFKAIDESYSTNETADKKTEMNEIGLSSIVLNLSDSVLRKVGQMDSAKDLWNKLEELYNDTPSVPYSMSHFRNCPRHISPSNTSKLHSMTLLLHTNLYINKLIK